MVGKIGDTDTLNTSIDNYVRSRGNFNAVSIGPAAARYFFTIGPALPFMHVSCCLFSTWVFWPLQKCEKDV